MSFGELLDKRSIWQVKIIKNVNAEQHRAQIKALDAKLFKYIDAHFSFYEALEASNLMAALFYSNKRQFELEDEVRTLEGDAGLQAAKKAREQNNNRVRLKRQVDELFGEAFFEQKRYAGDE